MEKYASLLSADASNYKLIIERLEGNGFSGLNFDVMDEHFVKTLVLILKSLYLWVFNFYLTFLLWQE